MIKTIRVALIDDHQLVRKGLMGILSGHPEVVIVGEGGGEEDILPLLEKEKVDILFLDFYIPKPVTSDLIKSIVARGVKVIMCSANTEEDLISGTLNAGVSGYIHKDIEEEELLKAVDLVMDGEVYLSHYITSTLSRQFIFNAKFGDKYDKGKLLKLTDREIEVIRFFSEGFSYKEIANMMNISARTVESHKTNIMEKLELKHTIDIVKYAIKNKLIDL